LKEPTLALYSVHILGDSPQTAAGAAFVRQSFNWKAFFFGPLWLLVHRLWAGLALWVAAFAILIAASPAVVSPGGGMTIALALQILLGLEANRLCEAKLAAQGYNLVEIISAPARDEAEIAFYRHYEVLDGPLADGASGAGSGPGS
jgi:hypothetical protein